MFKKPESANSLPSCGDDCGVPIFVWVLIFYECLLSQSYGSLHWSKCVNLDPDGVVTNLFRPYAILYCVLILYILLPKKY